MLLLKNLNCQKPLVLKSRLLLAELCDGSRAVPGAQPSLTLPPLCSPQEQVSLPSLVGDIPESQLGLAFPSLSLLPSFPPLACK